LSPRQQSTSAPGLSRSGNVPKRVRPLAGSSHKVFLGILGGDGREVLGQYLVSPEGSKTPLHAREHARAPRAIRLSLNFSASMSVLVPLDDLAVFHRSRLDGNKFIEAIVGQARSRPGCCGKMARRADQTRAGQFSRARRRRRSPRLRFKLLGRALVRRLRSTQPPDLRGQHFDSDSRADRRLADIAKSAAPWAR